MIGLKNSKKKGKTMVCPILFNVPRQVTLRGNVGTLDATRVVQQFKFGPRGAGYCTERVKIGLKNQEKIGEANGMLNLPIVPTQVTLS